MIGNNLLHRLKRLEVEPFVLHALSVIHRQNLGSPVRTICSSIELQGGSDKSGILQIFIKIYTAQPKIIQFHRNKNTLAEKHIENMIIQ
jgi:hypothetical protein